MEEREREREIEKVEVEDLGSDNRMIAWIKKAGVGAFLFFLIKGLLWLIIPFLIANYCTR